MSELVLLNELVIKCDKMRNEESFHTIDNWKKLNK
jgi:hypothetical protein